MSETPPPTAEQAWRAANEQLRRVVQAKDEEITILRAALGEERAARQRLERRLAELERRLGMDSTNSGTPTSKETIAAAARRKALRQSSERQRSTDRKRGGQKGHRGTGLEPTGDPDDTRQAPPPDQCPGCHQDLTLAPVTGWSWGQVWDLPPHRTGEGALAAAPGALWRLREDHDSHAALRAGWSGRLRAERERRGRVAGQ